MKCQFKVKGCNEQAVKEFDGYNLCEYHYDLWVRFYEHMLKVSEGGTKLLRFNGKVYRLNKDKLV